MRLSGSLGLALVLLPVRLGAADAPAPSASPPTSGPAVAPAATSPAPTPALPTIELRVQQTSVSVSHRSLPGQSASGIQITFAVSDVPGWSVLSMDDVAMVEATLTGGETLKAVATPMRHHFGHQPWMQKNLFMNMGWPGGGAANGQLTLSLPQHGALSFAHLQIKGTLLVAASADDTHVPVALTAGTATQVNAVPDEPMSFLLKPDGSVDYQSPCFWIPLLVGLHLRDAQQHELTRKPTGSMGWNQVTLSASAPIAGIDLEVMTKARKLAFVATWGAIPLMDPGDGKEPAAQATVTDAGDVDLVAAIKAAGGVPRMNGGFQAKPLPPPQKTKPGANF